jgi:hypothetical protein
MSNNSGSSSGGVGCFGVVQIVFIILKLVGVIDWSWWWVMSPTLFNVGFLVALLIVLVAIRNR